MKVNYISGESQVSAAVRAHAFLQTVLEGQPASHPVWQGVSAGGL